MSLRALVVGYGSIGARHAAVLAGLNCDVALVTARTDAPVPAFASIEQALSGFTPDYVVVANETAAHVDTLRRLAAGGFGGLVLVEKPLNGDGTALPEHRFRHLAVGYNLRFHPVLTALGRAIEGRRIVSVQAYAGQYLPDWRPGTDWRQSYSASVARGGGVLRDLSHELDYLAVLFGRWSRLAALGGASGALDIESDDGWGVLMETAKVPILTLQLNYLDRPGRREIVVNTADETFRADLVAGTLQAGREAERFAVERNDTYILQHRAMLEGRLDEPCTADEAMDVMATIGAIERAAATGEWVTR